MVEGNLVLFVGAGASKDDPSCLPLFDGLARQLAGLACVPFDEDVAVDYFLGSMPTSFDVHAHAKRIIAGSSIPNRTHRALVRIASDGPDFRIVTTNFDGHLEAAARAEGIEFGDRWAGPALPLGDDFTGIVHLHGSISRDARELVLTDQDFGCAYLTQAWATRFLLPMFQKFVVLFVGYSHDDPIMRYLALGLTSGLTRFALTDSSTATDPKWARLGVTAVGYPVRDNGHQALVAALEAWDARARMGRLEHRAKMAEVVEAGPSLTPVDRDYLHQRLVTVEGAQEFGAACSAQGLAEKRRWLHWLEDLPTFQTLFNGGEETPSGWVLGRWFAETFIADSALNATALNTVLRLGMRFSDGLRHVALWAAQSLSTSDEVASRRWRCLLATSVGCDPAATADRGALTYGSSEPEHHAVLRAALTPRLTLKRSWRFDDESEPERPPYADIDWVHDAHTLERHLSQAVDLGRAGDPRLSSLLESALQAAYDLVDAYEGPGGWDRLSFGRSAIEPHSQDSRMEPVDALVDALRSFGEKALGVGVSLTDRWWGFGSTLFRRLALHLLVEDGSRSGDEKLSWLLEKGLLYETALKHEVYRVLRAAVGTSSTETRARLLDAAMDGPASGDTTPDPDRVSLAQYSVFNLLAWLAESDQEWAEAQKALGAIKVANPQFEPREHLDFGHWMESGTWGGKLPIEPDEFIDALERDAKDALSDLANRDYSERHFEQPRWEDVLGLVRRVSATRPNLGVSMWQLIEKGVSLEERADSLKSSIVRGWADADLGGTGQSVVGCIQSYVSADSAAEPVAEFLLEQIERRQDDEESTVTVAMREIAAALWAGHCEGYRRPEGFSETSFAPLYLNSWPGTVAMYWVREVDRRWRKHRADWTGLNACESAALADLLGGPPATLGATRPALASSLFFLFAADPDFATAHLLPLFRDPDSALGVWAAYLHYPRYNDKMLAEGFLGCVETQWARIDQLGDELREQFLGLVASIVLFAGISTEMRQGMLDQAVLSSNGAYAAELATEVVQLLGDDQLDASEIWNLWLREYLQARLDGLPRTANPEELARWVDVVPFLGEEAADAIALVAGRGVGLGVHFVEPKFPSGFLSELGREIVDHYAERVHNSSVLNYLQAHHVQTLVEAIRDEVGERLVQPLMDEAVSRGFIPSATD